MLPVDALIASILAPKNIQCDVIVAGGSLSAMAAALTSAREGAQTCLLEPFDEIGGQMISVPAVDYPWHSVGTIKVGDYGKQPENLPKEFQEWRVGTMKDTGKCWVSPQCFMPQRFLEVAFQTVKKQPKLQVFYNTVVKSVETRDSGKRQSKLITAVIGIQRQFKKKGSAFDVRLSEDMPKWYSETEDGRFKKTKLRFIGAKGKLPIVIDATELGELMPLSGGAYVQGYDRIDGSIDVLDETCGQAIVFPFVREASSAPENAAPLPKPDKESSDYYKIGARDNGKPFTFEEEWSYRRLLAKGDGKFNDGDLSVTNWVTGNDYPFQYLFKTRAETGKEATNWTGGINYSTLEKAERHAIGWHYYLKGQAGKKFRIHTSAFRTSSGLSKFPYLRDTRRSVGIDNYLMLTRDVRGGSLITGTRFADRVAIGAYTKDLHATNCKTPSPDHLSVAKRHDTLPYYFPFRAFTNRDVGNLILSGKTLATSYSVSSATRLQPQEYATGIASGAIAAHMSEKSIITTAEALRVVNDIRTRIKKYTPTEWTIGGTAYPTSAEVLEPIPDDIVCPDGATFDHGYGYCVTKEHAYGPFTNAMMKNCMAVGGNACKESVDVTIKGKRAKLQRWKKELAHRLRGNRSCPNGSARMTSYGNYCVEGVDKAAVVYGPFGSSIVQKCIDAKGGTSCYIPAILGPFFLKNLLK